MTAKLSDNRLGVFADLNDDEKRIVCGLAGSVTSIQSGRTIRPEGRADPAMYVLRTGWAASMVPLSDGRCQILKIHLPGDLMGVPSLPFERSVERLMALTPVDVSPFPLELLGELFTAHPRIAAVMFLAAQQEHVFLMDRLASIGRTEAPSRVAALLLHLHERLSAQLGETSRQIALPLSQQQLGDVLGLSEVHVNRVLQQMERDRLIRRDKRQFDILEPDVLHAMSGLPQRALRRHHGWLPEPREGDAANGAIQGESELLAGDAGA